MSPKQFVNSYVIHANEVAELTGVPAVVTLAQAAWESGWSKHAPGFNFFGMKAGSSWTGKKQLLWTTEYVNGKSQRVQRWFRAYDSATDAFYDYALNLKNKQNYAKAFNHTNNPELFFKYVFEGGYATAPDYYTSVISVMKMIKKYVS